MRLLSFCLVCSAHSRFGANVFSAFGVDETSGVVGISKANDATGAFSPLSQTQVSVVDDKGKAFTSGSGSLAVKGYSLIAHSRRFFSSPLLTWSSSN